MIVSTINRRVLYFFVFLFLIKIEVHAQCGFEPQPNVRSGCQDNFQLNLQDTTTGSSNTSWNVVFGDYTSVHVSGRQYSQLLHVCGRVKVTMTTTVNGVTCTKVDSNFFVHCKPTFKGRFTPLNTCVGEKVCFLDSSTTETGCYPLRYRISFGQGLIDSVPGCRAYTLANTYCPTVVVINSCGCETDTQFSGAHCEVVTPLPTASFTGTPLNSCTTPLVSTMTATQDPPGTIYSWYINGSATAAQSGTSNVFNHSYGPGTFTVRLVTTNPVSGCSDTMNSPANYITVGNNPAACYTASATKGCAPKVIKYCPCSPGALSYQWSFPGAGVGGSPSVVNTTSNSTCLSVNYTSPAQYSSQLIVFYNGGCTDTLTRNNYVSLGGPLLGVDFTSPDTFSCILPEVAHLTYTGPACGTCTFQWDPPGNSTPNSPTGTTFTMNAYQVITPILKITDTLGCTTQVIKDSFLITQKLKAKDAVTLLHKTSCAFDTLLVVNTTSGGTLSSVQWSFPGATLIHAGRDTVYPIYSASGCHKYTLIVATPSGCIDTLKDSICIGTKPSVTMSISPHDLCFEELCNNFTFTTDPGTDTATSVLVWPEGLQSNITAVFLDTPGLPSIQYCYTYKDWGHFQPCFVAKLNGCPGDTVCASIADSVIIFPPAAKFDTKFDCSNLNRVTYINQSTGADKTVFVANGQTYINPISVTVLYPGPCGTYHPVSMTAYNYASGCIHQKADTTYIPCLGVDYFSVGNRKGCVGTAYQDYAKLIYTDSTVAHATNIVWSIKPQGVGPTFPTPSIPTLTGDSISYSISVAGAYTFCTQLRYASGCIDTFCKPAYVVQSKPAAAFTVSDTVGCTPLHITFTNTSTYQFAPQDSFYWNFADNSAIDSTTPNPTHIYTSVGVYVATLEVVDTNGCSSTATKQIVSNSIAGSFTASDTFTCTANPDTLNPITFTSTSTGFIAHYRWILPASLAPDNPNPGDVTTFSTRFGAEGSGNVCMVAIDPYGLCRDSVCKTVHVLNPIADYTLPHLSDTFHLCPPVAIAPAFIDQSHNNICRCFWDFGDGTTDTNCNAGHIYIHPGLYPVKHTVISCHGCTSDTTKYDIHIKGPVVTMHASGPGGCPCTPITYYLSSYDADQLTVNSGGGTVRFINLTIPRGTITNPTLDTVTFTYCGAADAVASVQATDNSGVSPCVVPFYSPDTIVIDTPSIDFSHRWRGCGSDTVCFTDQTHYRAAHAYTAQQAWDFGDGSPVDSSVSPCHGYPGPGNYTVTYRVKDNVGCGNMISYNVYIPTAPIAAFTVDDSVGCVPLLLHFSDSSKVDSNSFIASGNWNFGDGGQIAVATDTFYTYLTANTPPATYTATLTVTDGYGCAATASKQIQVRPTATISLNPAQSICLGDTFTILASGSPVLHWSPFYNIDTTVLTAARVWPRVDTTYYLRAGDMPRCYVTDSIRISVSIITASDSVSSLCLGQTTLYTGYASTTHATVGSYFWNYGDGTNGTGQSVSHNYAAYGTYIDSMIVTNSVGCRDTVFRQVIISDKPHAAFTVSDSSVCIGSPLIATNTSTAGVSVPLAGFTFDMQADGVPDFTTSPATYTYAAPGFYTVVLIQTDVNTCRDTTKKRVVVHSLPTAIFGGDSNCIKVPTALSGTAIIGDGKITHYNWTINGTAQTSDSATIIRTFQTPGAYNVCLSVSDIYRCPSLDSCQIVNILSQPLDTIDPLDTTICLGYSAGFHIKGRFSSIQWVPSVWLDNANSTDVVSTPRQTMQYLVYANYAHCRPKVDTVTITVIDSIPVEAAANPENIVLGLSSNLSSTVRGTIDSIVWDPDATLNCRSCRTPIASPKQTTTYTATIYYSKNGVTCSNRASVTINVIQSCDNSLIYIPNTFTPNNDHTNDVFRIRGQGITKVNYFRIYDRWGKVVYEATNVDNPDNAAWNGALNNDTGKPEDSGVFVYLFEVQCVTGQTITGKGNVTLIR